MSGHLSEKEEQSYWKQESIFPDQTSLERCLAARSACTSGDTHWPFIFDPHQQFESYLAALKFKTAANISSKEGTYFNFHISLQLNLSTVDTLGTAENVLTSEVLANLYTNLRSWDHALCPD